MGFSRGGDLLMVGDYGGRGIIFQKQKKAFTYIAEFQAHDKQLDYMTNQDISDMVSQILWLEQPSRKSFLTCNARQIKLWSLREETTW